MQILRHQLDDLLANAVTGRATAGYVAGVWHRGEQIELARGVANLNTGAEMTVDTRFQIGSVTKVMTTHLLMRYVESGRIRLDDPVVAHLPSFALAEPAHAQRLCVRHLLNHTNGIDADGFSPMAETGAGATRDFVSRLSGFGTLFEPGDTIHYSNPGFVVAARLIEVLSGKPYNQVLEEALFRPCGMNESCTSAEQAILHRHAVGVFANATTGTLQATHAYLLPPSLAGAGSTPISTVRDMLAYGRMHLAGGSVDGTQILAPETITAMQTVTFDARRPCVPPICLGWWKVPVSGVTVYWHGGTTYGTTSSFAICPELELVVFTAGTGPGASPLHDQVLLATLAHLGHDAVMPFERRAPSRPLSRYAGRYRHYPMRLASVAGSERLSVEAYWTEMDADSRRAVQWPSSGVEAGDGETRFAFDGGSTYVLELAPLADDLFAPPGTSDAQLCGINGRLALVSFRGDGDRPLGVHTRLRYLKRED
ncbi:MAG: beta-lactamase family protein [Burkholderia sp.]|jgi:CubicO group peptidase (beta-lactamase class C family)|uniref:serine hydrolase domain-containing protein n=3 Tax=Burkholderia sp. TaxID=36773 RepID=UPI0025888CDF|nr:serine hydrolase domain-containing protein [Burkholderia sp.]MCA3779559.1 beta-lactamase family protein [Burkholderia sp.]MCA3797779.1 beta-lactamase family protein [Burkholderia sp.]MCA3799805.1 beta-lactamase family protein [Burkholderia sp.]MCA3812395.1 beta-lactamase family protein [Burkholderia sp.]MCA3817920.1 beta-lactamase family protein [Burkholderia sp.]